MGAIRSSLRGLLVGTAVLVLATGPTPLARAGKLPRKPIDGGAYLPGGRPERGTVVCARSELTGMLVALGADRTSATERVGELPAGRVVELAGKLDSVRVGAGLGQAYVILIGVVVLLLLLDLLDEGIFIGQAAGAKQRVMADLGGALPWGGQSKRRS